MGLDQAEIEQAVILTGFDQNPAGAAALLRVARLPVVLRAILTAERAGATRFLVVLNPATGPAIRRALERSKRLPKGVEWLTLPESVTSLTAAMGEIARHVDDKFLLLPGEATFHSSLLDHVKCQDGDGVLALTVANRPTGIYRFSRLTAQTAGAEAPLFLQTLSDLGDWMSRSHLLQCEEVDEQLWHPIGSVEDLPRAEAKLTRWLYKETDGMFARFNRKLSIPISRLLIRAPITPNMVTIFALLVSLLSGAFFALGGYVNTLMGAVLSYLASVLDGSDGEVARLTFRESEFGCWLETMCDNVYYVFVYSGIVIGLYRTSNSLAYPIAGGLLAFGMIMSFIATGYQRMFVSHSEPEKYLVKWQEKMETHHENLLYRFARRHEFIVRRSFLPYAILFFALINFMDFVLFMSAFGANLLWSLSLYTNRAFRQLPATEAGSHAHRADIIESETQSH